MPPRLALLALLLVWGTARAEVVLRVATIVPDGTSWARELKAFAREIETNTHGEVKLKYYLGGIAGDELAVADRIRRAQLDGIVSGGVLCQKLAPSLKVTRVPGLFLGREEAAYVAQRLRPILDKEFQEAGFVNVGESIIGPAILFTRAAVKSTRDLQSGRYWIWDVDDATRTELSGLGMKVVPLPIAEAARAYDENRIDGFITPPTAALGFQWSTQARYYTALPMHYVIGCVALSNRSFDALSNSSREIVRNAGAKLQVRVDDQGRSMDEQLLGGLFAKQGLTPVEVSAEMRAAFLDLTRALRERNDVQVVPKELLDRVLGMLADFRGGGAGH